MMEVMAGQEPKDKMTQKNLKSPDRMNRTGQNGQDIKDWKDPHRKDRNEGQTAQEGQKGPEVEGQNRKERKLM